MSIRLTMAAALATVAALALPTTAAADDPLPPGACETHGAAGLAYETGVNCRFVEVDAHPRRYVVYVPDRRVPAAPVVFMFHGSSGTGEQFLRISGWREQADRTGLIAVFPTALQYRVLESGFRVTKWNEFGLRSKIDRHELPPGYPEDAPMPADDTGFVDAILADLDSRLPIDRRRIYMSGFSNGAGFAARLSVERSTRVAAAAYSAGGLADAKEPDRPVPTYITAGTLDDRLLTRTGLAELPLDPVEILANPVLGSFVDVPLATLGLDPGDFGSVTSPSSTLLRWPAPDPLLQFRMIARLEHRYPNGDNNPAGFAAAPEFWEFFRAHRLPRPIAAGGYRPRRQSRGRSAVAGIEAHITGTVWKIEVGVGDTIEEGDTVVVLESMKMEMPVEAEDEGTVKEVLVEEGQAVSEGDTLVVLE